MPLSPRSFTQLVPPTLLMQGACFRYGKSLSKIAPRQNAATSARAMDPASPSITLTTPVGASNVSPPGLTMQYSKSDPGPSRKSFSWLFLSLKTFFMTVIISSLKTNGAWPAESPAPMEVTTATRFTPFSFIAAITFVDPSVSIVSPTSLDLPPSEITTPVTSSVMTFATSAALVTSPWITVRLGLSNGFPALSSPPEPGGIPMFEGVLASVTTS
mmetsp:Transcript_20806/g.45605  ORF Transcript_20806/g.45605 Transcript_20806/m.45605 type:complete len:215 (-) Transcript_20806:293-937(-)